MTVWILLGYDRYDTAHIVGVFASKEAADEAYGSEEQNYTSLQIVEDKVQ